MWPFTHRRELTDSAAPIFFTNTMTGKKDLFISLKPGVVSMYSCGPTVYSRAHIGNMRAYIFSDTIARVLIQAGYHVRRVINITDVGHLVGDGDHGEDKMAKGAREEQKSPAEIASHYAKLFIEDLAALNVDTDAILFPRATEYIKEQIAMVKTLEERGFAYRAEDGIYFDTGKFPNYGRLGGANRAELLPGARIEKIRGKKSGTDFVLWRDAKPDDLQQWDSPWGRGNPGWHIECSAMIKSVLGTEIDIHTGGMDHIPTHHNNEIAQSEAVNDRPLARYWIHEAFLTVGTDKISKSLQNDVYISEIAQKGFDPLALRYLFLQAHYRTPLSFSWDSLAAAHESLRRLRRIAGEVRAESGGTAEDSEERDRFISHVRDDLGTPQALAILSTTLREEELSPGEKWGLIEAADALLGLRLAEGNEAPPALASLPQDIQKLVFERDMARSGGDFARADALRYELQGRGYRVEDGPNGTLLTKDAR
ncbi:MAG TPA: cysteine--tRNA ligase [Candidatus Paceibacterota bacterium]|nr:cysteine--tRNA ligase [Candidatus Paceibacterota bacterium]